MHSNFKALTISHKNAPVAIREQLALNEKEVREVLFHIREYYTIRDILVLSTCNRTEIYYASEEDLGEELVKILSLKRSTPYSITLYQQFQSITDHQEAVRHLFRVTIGLESQIIGDMQITNQVKNAYQLSADADLAGPFLHRLMHTTFYANKRVVQETAFRDGAASISYATLELIEQLTLSTSNPKVLILGLGTIGGDLCKNIADHKSFKNHRIMMANRTLATTQQLANSCGFQVIPWEEVPQRVAEADVVVSAVSAPQAIIQQKEIDKLNILSFKYFIDLSIPRSVEASIENINGVVLYNLDDIQSRTDQALNRRMATIPQVEAIVEEAIWGFQDWSKEMSVNPTINRLKNALEQIRRDEIARHLKNASEEEVDKVDKVTKSIMQKVIKLPVLQLKAACKRGEAETLIDLLNDLFDLEKVPATKNKK